MTEEEIRLSNEADAWIKKNEKKLIERFASLSEYESDTRLISLFMAGSPGAGKTEVARRLVEKFSKKPVLIDADEIRKMCPGYDGTNAHIYQKAATKGVHMLYNHVLYKRLNVIMDGTFAHDNYAENIERSLSYGRKVEIDFVYQEPAQAWEFTKKREAVEGRRITKEAFIKAFFKARENAEAVKRQFGHDIELNVVIKNIDNSVERFEINVETIDPYVKKKYTEDELQQSLL